MKLYNPLLLVPENTFKTMIDSMVNKEKWTPRDWSKILDSQLSSWMLKIPGMSNNQEKKQLEEYKGTTY